MPTVPDERRWRRRVVGAAGLLVVLVAIGLWRTGEERPGRHRLGLSTEPEGVMGTSCRLVAVVPPGRDDQARRALADAEESLRRIETLMSSWLADSEITRFNQAGDSIGIPLSQPTLEVLGSAWEAWQATGGAFDITVGPLVELWRRAGEAGVLPTEAAVAAARAASHWDLIEFFEDSAGKRLRSVQVDLGGIAKGYGIDRAVEAMQAAGAIGGLVEVGGDLRLFGPSPQDGPWPVEVRDPFGTGEPVEILTLTDAAVCTSGDYARFHTIEGRRYSHIIDPRTGRPAAVAASVTVIGPSAREADVWATALSVLGAGGLDTIPAGLRIILIAPDGTIHRRTGS